MISSMKSTILLALAVSSVPASTATTDIADPITTTRSLATDPDTFCYNLGTDCVGCLRDGCSFDGSQCIPDCGRAPAGEACYRFGMWPGIDLLATCRRAKNTQQYQSPSVLGGQTVTSTQESYESSYEVIEEQNNAEKYQYTSTVDQSNQYGTTQVGATTPPPVIDFDDNNKSNLSSGNINLRVAASEPFQCSEAIDCRECVKNHCGWIKGQCHDSCMDVMDDAICYSHDSDNLFHGWTGHEICRAAWEADRKQQICQSLEDCSACTSTVLVSNDQKTHCFWHPEGGYNAETRKTKGACMSVETTMLSQGTQQCSSKMEGSLRGGAASKKKSSSFLHSILLP